MWKWLERLFRKKQKADPVLTEGIAANASLYEGLYESIYQASKNSSMKNRDAYLEWCERTKRLDGEYPAAFEAQFGGFGEAEQDEYQEKMKELVEAVFAAGICREERTELEMDSNVRKAYLILDDSTPEDGAKLKVLKAAWEYDGRYLEQGILSAEM